MSSHFMDPEQEPTPDEVLDEVYVVEELLDRNMVEEALRQLKLIDGMVHIDDLRGLVTHVIERTRKRYESLTEGVRTGDTLTDEQQCVRNMLSRLEWFEEHHT